MALMQWYWCLCKKVRHTSGLGAHRKCSVSTRKASWKPKREASGKNKPATPSSWTLTLQTREKIKFLFFKLPMYWEHTHLLITVV